MKRSTIVNTYKEYQERCNFISRVFNRVPFKRIGEPDTQSKEWERYQQATTELDKWLEEDV